MHSERVLPIYAVCDRSLSMGDQLAALNAALCALHRAMSPDPDVAAHAQLCLIGFSRTAEILLPLSPVRDIAAMPYLTAGEETNFGVAFEVLRETIARDAGGLAGRSHPVARPVVLFVSDGQPTDPVTWWTSYVRLADLGSMRPRMVALGIGDVDPVTIARIGTFRAFICPGGMTVETALLGLASTVTGNVVRSGPV